GAADAAGNGNVASTSTDNAVTYAPPNPQVTVDQAAAQADPTNRSPVVFIATFNQAVTGFGPADVVLGGTALPTTVVISGAGPVYTLSVSGMSAVGTVTASIPAGAVTGAVNGLLNFASTGTDNVVTFDNVAPGLTLSSIAKAQTNVTPVQVTVTWT